jgi:hypothetical protein
MPAWISNAIQWMTRQQEANQADLGARKHAPFTPINKASTAGASGGQVQHMKHTCACVHIECCKFQ